MRVNIVIPQDSGRHETLFSVNMEQIPPVGAVLAFPARKRVLQVTKQVWTFLSSGAVAAVDLQCRAPARLDNPLYQD